MAVPHVLSRSHDFGAADLRLDSLALCDLDDLMMFDPRKREGDHGTCPHIGLAVRVDRLRPGRGAVDHRWEDAGSGLGGRKRLFVDPTAAPGQASQASADLTRLTGEVAGQLGARVTVDFQDRFDAGVLVAWVDQTTWLKLCLEFSPAGRGSVVSVVTVSDDANSWDVPGDTVYLRVSRMGTRSRCTARPSVAAGPRLQHRSADRPSGRGGLSRRQSLNGAGCRAVFADITFTTRELSDTRDGS